MDRKWGKTYNMFWPSEIFDLFDVSPHNLFDAK